MKKTLLLALALAVPAMAGVSAPLAVAPNPDNTPAPQPAPVVSPWSVEIGGVYRWPATISTPNTRMWTSGAAN